MKLAIVTATINLGRASPIIMEWAMRAVTRPAMYVVVQDVNPSRTRVESGGHDGAHFTFLNEPEILGVVPAFAKGVQAALDGGADIIACLHDDLQITEDAWDAFVIETFDARTNVGLLGFGGAEGLADADIYKVPYNPMQLARKRFLSNMRDAEAHGERVHQGQYISVLDGFSQVGRRDFWQGWYADHMGRHNSAAPPPVWNLFGLMQSWGIVHHAYDAALGCFAARLGWDVWLLPIACHHHGGLTAVADPRYHAWADQHAVQQGGIYAAHMPTPQEGHQPTGDQRFWSHAHRIVYDQFRDVLPLRLT